jgi:hypothetical protein
VERSRAGEAEICVNPNGTRKTAEAGGWQIEWDRKGLSAWAGGMSATSSRLIIVFISKETGRRGYN